jgi:SAM-dependent methyltransferase
MEWTGERMIPAGADPLTFWEHIYRYRFATHFVQGKRVLDIACGEGYGTAALRDAGAASVVGVDISNEACEHARLKYGLDARTGSAEEIPLADDSVDLIVSFETVEHIASPDRFIRECARVLSPGGKLVISTPNREVYRVHRGDNDFHCSEMSHEEFAVLLNHYFRAHTLYGQSIVSQSWLAPSPLTVLTSPWDNLPGGQRVRNKIQRWLCPHLTSAVDEQQRDDVVRVILYPDDRFCAHANPYAVRSIASMLPGDPMYLIALAEL